MMRARNGRVSMHLWALARQQILSWQAVVVSSCRCEHVCFIEQDDASVKCWGDNAFGQLGYGDTVGRGGNSTGEESEGFDHSGIWGSSGRATLSDQGAPPLAKTANDSPFWHPYWPCAK